MAKKQTAIAKQESAMYTEERPDYLPQNTDVGRGQENVGVEDMSIPRLDLIQSLSPQRKKNDPAYIEGAEEGMLFNSITSTLYGEKVLFVPCFFRKEWLIWKMQDAGGGFNGAFPNKEAAEEEFKKQGFDKETFKDKHGNQVPAYEIVDTGQHFGLIIRPESTGDNLVADQVVISMSKSKMKISRQLNTMVKMSGGDRFSRIYEIGSAAIDGPKGAYYNFSVRPLGYVGENIYKAAEQLYKAVSDGALDVNRNYDTPAAAESTEY